jgi:putative endonuclease
MIERSSIDRGGPGRTLMNDNAGARSAGARYEDIALAHLARAGLELIARNYRCRYGEIDLVMRERETLVFVEVRYRRSSLFGGGIDSVHAGKRAKLVRAAEVFLINHPRHAGAACRFDVVALTGDDAASAPDWRRNAFEA